MTGNESCSKIKNFDIFGNFFTFEHEDNKQFKTLTGACFTFILFFSLCILRILFGKDVWERKSPNVTTCLDHIPYSKINMTNLPVMIAILNNMKMPFTYDEISSLFDFQVVHSTTENSYINNNIYKVNQTCDPSKYSLNSELMNDVLKEGKSLNLNYVCFNISQNMYIQNSYGSKNSSFISFQINKCDATKRNCHPQLELLTSLFYVNTIHLNSYINPQNYTNPLTYIEESYIQQVGNKFQKTTFFTYAIGLLETNDGYMFDNKEQLEFFYLSSSKEDIYLSIDNLIYAITFDSTQLRKKLVRSYLKASDIISKIGGLYTGFVISLTLILKDYSTFKYYSLIYNLYKRKISPQPASKLLAVTNLINYNAKISAYSPSKNKNDKSSFGQLKNECNIHNFQLNMMNQSYCNNVMIKNIEEDINISYLKLLLFKFVCFCCKSSKIKTSSYKLFKKSIEEIVSFKNYIDLISNHIVYKGKGNK